MPLQEARRQKRQRCGEGIIRLDLLAEGPARSHQRPTSVGKLFTRTTADRRLGFDRPPRSKLENLRANTNFYVETFLAAAYPMGDRRAIAIVPLANVSLPKPEPMPIDKLIAHLPAHSIVLNEDELLRRRVPKGTTQTYARVMAMWERLAAPFLAAADASVDPIQKIEGYRKTIAVDYACELALSSDLQMWRGISPVRTREKLGMG